MTVLWRPRGFGIPLERSDADASPWDPAVDSIFTPTGVVLIGEVSGAAPRMSTSFCHPIPMLAFDIHSVRELNVPCRN